MFDVVAIADDVQDDLEPLGTKPKFWFRTEAGDGCLFKEARPDTGEDWAEKIACELARHFTGLQMTRRRYQPLRRLDMPQDADLTLLKSGSLGWLKLTFRAMCSLFLTTFRRREWPDMPPLLPCGCWS
jgi:hypothetical protein